MPPLNESGDATMSLKCDESLPEQLDDAAEAAGYSSRSEFARHALADAAREVLGSEPGELDDDELTSRQRKAATLLKENTYPDGSIPADEARSLLSENMGIKKERIKRSVFKPLEEAGVIQPTWGRIRVLTDQ